MLFFLTEREGFWRGVLPTLNTTLILGQSVPGLENVDRMQGLVTKGFIQGYSRVICYRYRYVLAPATCDHPNLVCAHPSLLPWNRGADPIYWALKEGTPIGASLFKVVPKLDAGPVLLQTTLRAKLNPDHTLHEVYTLVDGLLVGLIHAYLAGNWVPGTEARADHKGTYHRADELPVLPQGWNTRICDL